MRARTSERKREREWMVNEGERRRQGRRKKERGRRKGPMRRQGRRHQINVRLMLLFSTLRGIENSGFWSRSRLRREGFPPRFSLYQPASPSASASVMKTFARRHFTDFLVRFFSDSQSSIAKSILCIIV